MRFYGGAIVLALLALLVATVHGIRRFRWPRRADAMARIDATLPGRPLAALADAQAIGSGDPASESLWQTHQARMAERAGQARAVEPDLRLSRRDPFGLRYIALLGLVVALLFRVDLAGWQRRPDDPRNRGGTGLGTCLGRMDRTPRLYRPTQPLSE